MRRWRAAPSAGSLVGILALLLALGGITGLVLRAIPQAGARTALVVGLWALVAALALASVALVVLLWGYYSLSYRLDEADGGALVLRWAWRTVRIPIEEIEYLGLARQLLPQALARRPAPWPGYYLGSLHDEGLGRVQLLATLAVRRQLLVCSARGSYAFSPDRPGALMAQFAALNAARQRSGPLASALPALSPPAELEEEEELAYPSVAATGQRAFRERTADRALVLFADRPAVMLLLLGGALIAAMLWFIVLRYDAVPQTLPLHYSTTGQPDRIGTPREVFTLPLITALVAVANIALAWNVIRFDRFAARLLLGGTCLVQAVAWVALLKLFQ